MVKVNAKLDSNSRFGKGKKRMISLEWIQDFRKMRVRLHSVIHRAGAQVGRN